MTALIHTIQPDEASASLRLISVSLAATVRLANTMAEEGKKS